MYRFVIWAIVLLAPWVVAAFIPGTSDITLTWDAVTHDTLAGYHIYAGYDPGGPYDLVGTVGANTTEFTWYEMPDNVDLFFVATAFSADDESTYSNEVCGYSLPEQGYGIECGTEYEDCDFDNDGDIDGSDLAVAASGSGGRGCLISTLAEEFGNILN